jgi:hypothetical protein
VVLNPYSLLRPVHYWAPAGPDSLTWSILMAHGALWPPRGLMLAFIRTWPYAYQLVHVMPYAWGPALMPVLLAGLAWGARRLVRREAAHLWPVLVAALTLVLLMAGMRMKTVRDLLPLTPLLCVLAGALLATWAAHPRRSQARLGWLAGGLALAASLAWCVGYLGIYARPDNRVAALQWLGEHTTAADTVAYEVDDAWGAAGESALRHAGAYKVDRLMPTLYGQDLVGQPLGADVLAAKREYLADILAQGTVLVLTDTNLSRLGRLPKEFPETNRLYQDLMAGRTAYRQKVAFTSGLQFLGMRVPEQWAEGSFRLFDHPRVYVFRKVGSRK